jgi:hypothetical protein
MARTIEVGRAVLSCPTHDLELWLTTLITISPLQQPIDSQQLSSCAFLSLLASGDVWVGRGNGMRVDVELTLRGEHLPHQQSQELVKSIMSAAVSATHCRTGYELTTPGGMGTAEPSTKSTIRCHFQRQGYNDQHQSLRDG